jgi:aspartate kinase
MNRPLEILKFGGSSVATPERMRSLASLVAGRIRSGTRVAVVVSAMGSTTDDLIDLARDVSETGRGRLDGREMDQLLATGEQQSVALFALALKAEGIEARSFTAQQAGFRAKGFPWRAAGRRGRPGRPRGPELRDHAGGHGFQEY